MFRKIVPTLKIILLGLVLAFSVAGFGLAPLAASADTTPTQTPAKQGLVNCQSSLPGTAPASGELPSCDLCQLVKIVNTIFNYAFVFLGGAAVLMLIVAGFLYITAAGSPELITKAKKTLQFAIIGIVVVILSFLIVGTILKIFMPDKTFFGSIQCQIDSLLPGASETTGSNGGSNGNGGGSSGGGGASGDF